MKTVAIYARVSTQEQSPDMQLIALREFAEKRGFKIFREYVDVVSGVSETREQYNQLFSDVRKRLVDVVMVWKFDRFARSTKMLLAALDEFHNLGIDFISYQENIDTTSAIGRVMLTLISAIAEFEREMIVARVKAGLHKAKLQGKRIGRPPVSTGKKQRVRELRKEGLSIRQISAREQIAIGSVSKCLRDKAHEGVFSEAGRETGIKVMRRSS